MTAAIHEFSTRTLDGKPLNLADYAGKVLLIVNTASNCGFTPQYAGLEALQRQYGARGLVVLGFPCNQFGAQEPGSEAEIGAFCEKNYGVTFPLSEKVEVNGEGAHPLFKYLTKEAPGLLGTTAIKWNFTKFLVDRDGNVVERFAPTTKPEELAAQIETLLA
ncbi:glutathione peroxidase [Niveibacterium microcysteis]|uniref:Glutathione peroxidase n=1 Tax=Niveibacterium microcysteis TaxID=2811415 RepID=A0ABX7M374_9RHOO|nr:glutathione peroxidase [Niveibacterium microcysteis]QSI75154.1 glutathione peroxidase [Niveibacterium microcysteis]